MRKKFNTTGICIPEKHYMVDISKKIDEILNMIEEESYFTINRPRQYGKTTTLLLLERKLVQDGYLVLSLSFEGMGDERYKSEKSLIEGIFLQIRRILSINKQNELLNMVKENEGKIDKLDEFGEFITEFIVKSNKKVVLMIDEVDKSSDNQSFLSFLGVLRNKYLLRSSGKDYTFHSVILAGVHDVKTLKLKIRPDEERKYNSPWNIAAQFEVNLSFNAEEIGTMLEDYGKYRNISVDIKEIAEKLYYYTSGYPFLVSRLCEIIDTKILPKKEKHEWLVNDIETAVGILLKESNPNFDDLIKNLENNAELYETVYSFIIEGIQKSFNIYNPVINLGVLYGILRQKNEKARIHNRVYEQLIYDYMSSKKETSNMTPYNFKGNFIEGNMLNMEKVLLKFQQFMKEQYSGKDEKFIEREGRLLFLAFIKPIINGEGFDFKEVQISEERRLDIVITYLNRKYVIELKIWRGREVHEKGIRQIKDYIDRVGVDNGYIVIYDFNKNKEKEWQQDRVNVEGKEIFMVRV